MAAPVSSSDKEAPQSPTSRPADERGALRSVPTLESEDEVAGAIGRLLGEAPGEDEPEAAEAEPEAQAQAEPEGEGEEAPAEEPSEEETPEGDPAAVSVAPVEGSDSIETLEDFATAAGIEGGLEALGASLTVPGPEGERIPLAQALELAREAPAVSAQRMELRTKEQELLKRETEELAQRQQVVAGVETDLHRLIEVYRHDQDQIDWPNLKRNDPEAYREARARFDERRQELEAVIGRFDQAKQQVDQEAQQTNQRSFQEKAQAEQATLLEKRPEWKKDPKARKAAGERIISYLQDAHGVDIQEFYGQVPPNHVFTLILDDAAAYHELVHQKKKIALRKLEAKPLPKVPKPGVRSEPADTARAEVEKTAARLRASGSLDDAARAIAARME